MSFRFAFILASLFTIAVTTSLVAAPLPPQEEADEHSNSAKETGQPNVLFIAIDDMNDWTGFLGGHPQASTPNLDGLASRGTNFTNAHCIAPACSPCRLALLYGVEPHHSGLYPFYEHNKIPAETLAGYTSLPRFFRDHGYGTFGAGKIFHGSHRSADDWKDYHRHTGAALNYAPEKGYQQGESKKMAFCPTTNPLQDHPDYQVASYGVDILNRHHERPFFLAVGIVKPHLAFVCPEQFFEQHSARITAPAVKADDLADVPWVGRSMAKLSDDYRYRTDEAWERVHRAYLACISWADWNIGRVLDALQASPYADNTIIVVWSDHGYHQGEKRSFRKFSLWEESTRVPFIIYDPRQHTSAGGRECRQAVSLINIYRTLGELAGLEVPAYVDGESLVPQLSEPDAATRAPAITTWGRGNYAVRSQRWRYIRYFDGGEELYDHGSDPQEWNNLANSKDHRDIKSDLRQHLPSEEAPLVREGISLWNVIDADQPNKLQKFRKNDWPSWKKRLQPSIE